MYNITYPALKKLTGQQIQEMQALQAAHAYTPETVLNLVKRFPSYPDVSSAKLLAEYLHTPTGVVEFLRKELAALPFVLLKTTGRGAIEKIEFRHSVPGYVYVGHRVVTFNNSVVEGTAFSLGGTVPFTEKQRAALLAKYKAIAEAHHLVFIDGSDGYLPVLGEILSQKLNAYILALELPARLRAQRAKALAEVARHG